MLHVSEYTRIQPTCGNLEPQPPKPRPQPQPQTQTQPIPSLPVPLPHAIPLLPAAKTKRQP